MQIDFADAALMDLEGEVRWAETPLSNKADPPSRQLLLLLIFSDLNQDNVLNKTYSYVIFLWPTAPYLTHLNMQREAFNITWSVKMLVM